MVQRTIFACNLAAGTLDHRHAALQQNVPPPETGSWAVLDKDE
jgi:hypothetical protein